MRSGVEGEQEGGPEDRQISSHEGAGDVDQPERQMPLLMGPEMGQRGSYGLSGSQTMQCYQGTDEPEHDDNDQGR